MCHILNKIYIFPDQPLWIVFIGAVYGILHGFGAYIFFGLFPKYIGRVAVIILAGIGIVYKVNESSIGKNDFN